MHMFNSSDLSARKALNASRTANSPPRIFLLRFGHIATVALSRRVAACPKLLRKIKRCAEAARGMHNPLDGCSSGFLAVPRRQHRRRALSHAALDPPRCFCAAGFRRSLDRPLLWRRRLPQRTVPTSGCCARLRSLHVSTKRRALEETCAARATLGSCRPHRQSAGRLDVQVRGCCAFVRCSGGSRRRIISDDYLFETGDVSRRSAMPSSAGAPSRAALAHAPILTPPSHSRTSLEPCCTQAIPEQPNRLWLLDVGRQWPRPSLQRSQRRQICIPVECDWALRLVCTAGRGRPAPRLCGS